MSPSRSAACAPGGDAGRAAEVRDALETWTAPFQAPPIRMATTSLRFAGVTWGDEQTALVEEWRYADRKLRTLRIAPGAPGSTPEARPAAIVWERSFQDEYANPGRPLTAPGPYGAQVLRRTPTGGLLLDGPGVSPEGVYPFLDRFEWTQTTRLWQAQDPHHERLVDVLDDTGAEILTWRQSQTEPPNLWRRRGAEAMQRLTAFADWAPAFARVRKEVVTYARADGLPLSATVYLPPGHEAASGPAPALFWVYPNEFKRRSDAGQVKATENTFARPFAASHLFFALQGWVVVDGPVLPIVAEGDDQPNDTYVAQLVQGATAAVDALAARGWIDRSRLVVGGHSYGAFTTANLLAHTRLFRAGIARSGAYNRTLTPFGFQGEERTFWQAADTYAAMSPFHVADRIDRPLLLIHGAEDANSGSWPMQSERLYQALKGLGAQVRWVELPAEDHGYRARESVGHALWEMLRWAELWTGRSA
jgi:dipeptidyl aminopeptidase/acylaminoacyl peptidase